MRNVTITLSDDVVLWARVWAARHDTSVSHMVAQLLESQMRREESSELALQEYLAIPTARLKGGGRYPRREDLYER